MTFSEFELNFPNDCQPRGKRFFRKAAELHLIDQKFTQKSPPEVQQTQLHPKCCTNSIDSGEERMTQIV